jgi:hypothetical protein
MTSKSDTTVMPQPQYLNRAGAAEYLQRKFGLRTSRSTLEKAAVHGNGPAFRYVGRQPVYSPLDLDEFANGRLSGPRRSTSEAA